MKEPLELTKVCHRLTLCLPELGEKLQGLFPEWDQVFHQDVLTHWQVECLPDRRDWVLIRFRFERPPAPESPVPSESDQDRGLTDLEAWRQRQEQEQPPAPTETGPQRETEQSTAQEQQWVAELMDHWAVR